jgi:hypothetical protein
LISACEWWDVGGGVAGVPLEQEWEVCVVPVLDRVEPARDYPIASHLGPPVAGRAHTAFITAMHLALLTAAGAVMIAAATTLILLARRWQTRPQTALSTPSNSLVALATKAK